MIKLSESQLDAVRWLASRPYAILADEPGVGKSYPALDAAPSTGRVLIICPSYLMLNWKKYVRDIHPDEVPTLVLGTPGQKRDLIRTGNRFTIVSYGIAARALKDYGELVKPGRGKRWSRIILDEAHRLRGRKTKRLKAIKAIIKRSETAWMLTATPMIRDGGDLWALLNICDRKRYSSYWRFVGEHCHLRVTPWSTEVGAVKDHQKLRQELSPYLLRRTLREAGVSLDDPVVRPIYVSLHPNLLKAHNDLKREYRATLGGEVIRMTSMGGVMASLRSFTGQETLHGPSPKALATLGLLGRYPGEPVVVFTWYREARSHVADLLRKERNKRQVYEVDSAWPQARRDRQVERWKASEDGVLVSTIGVLGEGANLQHSRVVVLYESDWLSEINKQAVGRCHRRGQKRGVIVHPLIVQKSVDELVHKVSQARADDVMRVFGAETKRFLAS